MDAARETGKNVHLMGLVSDGGVHSHNTHLYALLEMCKRRGVENVYVHCFLDGRDVPPTSGIDYVRELEAKLDEIAKFAGFHIVPMIFDEYGCLVPAPAEEKHPTSRRRF